MTSKQSTRDQDKELLERYRRASDTDTAAPSEAVRAAILAEGRRAAEQRATEVRGQPFAASRSAANDSRWKITAFGTAGAALVAALLFAPRLWESAPPAPPASSAAPVSPHSSEPLQEVVIAPPAPESSNAAGGASPKLSAPAAQARPMDLSSPLERRRAAAAQSVAPAEKTNPQNYAPPVPQAAPQLAPQAAPPAAPAAPPIAPASSIAPLASSLNAARVARASDARASSTPHPTALQSAAAAGDTAQTTALLDNGAALDARDELGRTPLMLAVMQSRLDVVRLLLGRGADPNIADGAGRTPLQRAKQENLREIAALLERAGAR